MQCAFKLQVLDPGSPFKPQKGKFHVIQLDFADLETGDVDVAKASMMDRLVHSARRRYGIDISDAGNDIGFAVALWVERLNATRMHPVVMLVDEYDSPIIRTLAVRDPAMAEQIATRFMAPFFIATKSLSERIHKVFVTGVSKVGMNAALASANGHYRMLLNSPEFCSLYGFTEAELRTKYVCIGNENQIRSLLVASPRCIVCVRGREPERDERERERLGGRALSLIRLNLIRKPLTSCRSIGVKCFAMPVLWRSDVVGTASIFDSLRGSRPSGVQTSRG